MQPPTVVHVITGLEAGGAETMLCKIVAASNRFHNAVISLGSRGALAPVLERAGASVRTLEMRNSADMLMRLLKFRRLLRSARPDLVHSWLPHANLLTALVKRIGLPEIPLLWNVRQSLDSLNLERWGTRRTIAMTSRFSNIPARIIYNSQRAAQQHEAIGYPSAKGVVIPNGFDLSRFCPSDDGRAAVRRQLGIGEDELVIGLIARAHAIKNHAGFVDAAALVLKREPEARFLLAGAGTLPGDGLMQMLVNSEELRNRLMLLGPRQDIPEITRCLDIACNVSHAEAFSNTVGEAMASGVPCIVTDVGDSASIVGDSGIVVEDDKAETIAAAMFRMIEIGRAGRAELGRLARERVSIHYSLTNIALRYETLYREVLADSTGG